MYSADSAVPSAVKLKMLLFSLVSAVSRTPFTLTQRCPGGFRESATVCNIILGRSPGSTVVGSFYVKQ